MKIKKLMIRFDDLCPNMDWDMWDRADRIMREYSVKPLIGVVPDCRDPELNLMEERKDFWNYIKSLQQDGYVVAMHGYQHIYDKQCRGMINTGYNTEFAGHPYEVQYDKIKRGKMILLKHGILTDVFFAPSHSYDENTLKALHECGFKYISDGKSSRAIYRENIMCVPCRTGGIPKIHKYGLYTAVFHTNMWSKKEYANRSEVLRSLCQTSSAGGYISDFNELVEIYTQMGRGIPVFQIAQERTVVFYERHIRPVLSKVKRALMP